MQTLHYRTCNLCEAMCGLEIKHENGKVLSIVGDKNDTFSRGHICPKALAMKDLYEDPNRLRQPVQKQADGTWKTIGWEEAFDFAIQKIKEVQAKHGNNSVAMYQGNPSIHNLGTMMFSPAFAKSLRTKNHYTATSTDQLPHHFASWLMFGHPMLLPIPDIDHTDFMLIIGGNPMASNGSMMTVPDVSKRLAEIQQRGGKFVVIDPRRTETAEKADEHIFITPGTDALLLIGMLKVIFEDNLVELNHLTDFTDNIMIIKDLIKDFDLNLIQKTTKIPAEKIQSLTREFISSKTGVVYGRVGVSTQAFGGICQWLINVLNIVSGNFDRKGGAMFTLPAIDFLARAKHENRFNRWQSRVRKLPEFLGETPVATLADEILTEGEGQIKCLITSCGNPVLSIPNGSKLDNALQQLDFMLAVDIFINETTRHADLIIPPLHGLEASHYDLTFHVLAVRNTTKYSPPMVAKPANTMYDWEIFQELTNRLTGNVEAIVSPETKLDLGLQFGPYKLSMQALIEHPHGIDLGELKPCLPDRLIHENKKINLAPEILVADIERLKASIDKTEDENSYLLIGRRHLRDNNSWMHNSPLLQKGKNRCTLLINDLDAKNLHLENNQHVKITSRVGSIEAPIEVSAEMMQGVVSLPHGYGHNRNGVQLDVAKIKAGVSVNDITDDEVIDELTGNAAFSNVWVQIKSLN